MQTDNNAKPFWWVTGVSPTPDGFISAEEALRGLPSPEEFASHLENNSEQ